mgnify:CR=1 FL=1
MTLENKRITENYYNLKVDFNTVGNIMSSGERESYFSSKWSRGREIDGTFQIKNIEKALKKGPISDPELEECKHTEMLVCPEFIGTNHLDTENMILKDTVDKLTNNNPHCSTCMFAYAGKQEEMKDIIRNPDKLETKCVDGKGVEILTTPKEYTNVFYPRGGKSSDNLCSFLS